MGVGAVHMASGAAVHVTRAPQVTRARVLVRRLVPLGGGTGTCGAAGYRVSGRTTGVACM